MTSTFHAKGKKKRAKAFVNLELIADKPCRLIIHNESLQAYIGQHPSVKNEFDSLIALIPEPSNIDAYVHGGGIRSQLSAIKTAIARAAQKIDVRLVSTLRKHNLVTCDARKKERKKYGLKKARRASQFSKR